MKILFINHIPEHFIKDQDPLGIMSLSASLKTAGHEVSFCSPRIPDVQKMLEVFPASIAAYSVTTGYHNFYLAFNNALKKRHKNIFSIFGGPHTTFMPDFIEKSMSIVKFLIFLPLKPLYSIIHVIFKGYCGSRLYPFKKTLKEQLNIFVQLFQQHHLLKIK